MLRNRLVDCLFIGETKLDSSHLDARFKVDNYNFFRRDNPRDRGGGLVCYIRSDIPAYQVNPNCAPMEALQINCIVDRQKWSILGLYRKPSLPQRIINEKLDSVLDENFNQCDKCILIGDLNCDMLKCTENAVSKLCTDFNLENIIKDPTCFKGKNPTLLDVILVSDKSICKNGSVTPCPLSDFHHFVHGVFKTQMPRTTTRKILYRSYKHFCPEDFGSDLRKAPFHVGEVLDIHSHMEYFQDLFLTILDQHAPIKSKTIRTTQCPHMTKEWKNTIYKRNMAYNIYRQNKSKSNWEHYRKLRNKCSNLAKSALKGYFSKNCSEKSSNSFWKVIKPYFSRKSNGTESIQLDTGNRIVSDPQEVAEIFNDYYLNIAETIGCNSRFSDNVENHPSFDVISSHVVNNEIPRFDFKCVNQKQVADIIDRLPTGKSPGYDNISGKVVSAVKPIIVIPVQCLIN